jgi:hypothetical protein
MSSELADGSRPVLLYPIAHEQAVVRVAAAEGSVYVLMRNFRASAGVRLTANEARALASALADAAPRVEG